METEAVILIISIIAFYPVGIFCLFFPKKASGIEYDLLKRNLLGRFLIKYIYRGWIHSNGYLYLLRFNGAMFILVASIFTWVLFVRYL